MVTAYNLFKSKLRKKNVRVKLTCSINKQITGKMHKIAASKITSLELPVF